MKTPMKSTLCLLAGTLLLGLAACNENGRKSQLSQVVWANDGVEVATIVQRWDETGSNPDGTPIKANLTHQLYLQKLDGGNKRILSNELPGADARDFYYIHSAGYAVASYFEPQADGSTVKRYYQLRLNGGQAYSLTSKPDMAVIPSPDGSSIARVTLFPSACTPNGSSSNSDACHVDVEFVNPNDLKVVGSKEKITFSSREKLPELTWTPEGKLVATSGSEAFAVKAGETPQSVPVPGCTQPQTSSSQVDKNGVYVFIDGNSVKSRLEATMPRFGCQTGNS